MNTEVCSGAGFTCTTNHLTHHMVKVDYKPGLYKYMKNKEKAPCHLESAEGFGFSGS